MKTSAPHFARIVSVLFVLSMIGMVVTAPLWVPLAAYDAIKSRVAAKKS